MPITPLKIFNVCSFTRRIYFSMKINKNNFFRNAVITLYLIFCSYMVGVKNPDVWKDYFVYLKYFDDAKNNIFYILTNVQDPLFVILMHPFASVNNGFDVFLFSCAFITLSLKLFSIRRATEHFGVFIILYSAYLLCLHDYIQIRVALALAFFIFALYGVSNKVKKNIVFVIALFCHLSIIVPMLIYYACNSKVIGYKKVILLAPSIILFSFLIQRGAIFIDRVNQYLELQKDGIGIDINIFSTLPLVQLVTILIIIFSKKYENHKNTYEFVMAYVGVIIFYSTLSIPAVALRCFEISNVFFIVLLSRLLFKSYYFMLIFFIYIVIGIKNYGQLLDIKIPFLTM